MRPVTAALAALILLVTVGAPARAAETWAVRSGDVVIHFNVDLLRDLGIDLTVLGSDAVGRGAEVRVEEPSWTFALLKGTDLQFRASHGVVEPAGSARGALRFGGMIVIRDRQTGRTFRLGDLEIADGRAAAKGSVSEGGADPLLLRSGGKVFCEMIHSMFRFDPTGRGLAIHYLNARITESWANAAGRPELAGWIVGMAEVRAEAEMLSSTFSSGKVPQPRFWSGPGDTLDVSLGILNSLQLVGREGTYPNGKNGMAMSTTSCNLGNVDVPWLAPMQENHPMIHMALYRLLDGKFEQIGVSWLKHGFFALSNSQCTPCENPSDGSWLGVGCSDTYSVSNNSSRSYLGPRNEVNAFTGAWECTGSHFSDGQPDCLRRHDTSDPHGPTDHRLLVSDADLGNPGATYYYEAYYIIRDDQDLKNNWGSRRATFTWSGSTWTINTPTTGNALLWGPALERWGDLRTNAEVAPGDGEVLLGVQTTVLGDGMYRYEFALLNKNSDRQIRSFSIPVRGVSNITNIGFHDNDLDPATDWAVTVDNGTITWQTDPWTVNPNANALVFGYMFNFRFDCDAAPADVQATLGLFKPGTGSEVAVATRGPANGLVDVPGTDPAPAVALGIRPNPMSRGAATISFSTVARGARLEIYDAAGRRVRSLIDDSREAGNHTVIWDGYGDGGGRVPPGVYYTRLRDGARTQVKPVIVVE